MKPFNSLIKLVRNFFFVFYLSFKNKRNNLGTADYLMTNEYYSKMKKRTVKNLFFYDTRHNGVN